MKTFLVSDTHFGHSNVLKYCPNRKFDTIRDHDEHLIQVWNSAIGPSDKVFHLGDFAFLPLDKACEILSRLNGIKILLAGNHDSRLLKEGKFQDQWFTVKDSYFEIDLHFEGKKTRLVMCHYPLLSWNLMRYGSFHAHGHLHTPIGRLKIPFQSHRKDVGVDSREDHAPWELNNLLITMSKEQSMPVIHEE